MFSEKLLQENFILYIKISTCNIQTNILLEGKSVFLIKI